MIILVFIYIFIQNIAKHAVGCKFTDSGSGARFADSLSNPNPNTE